MKIPEYQRRRLASSVVGTAGVDTSSSELTNTVGRTAGALADVAGKIVLERKKAMDTAVAFDTHLTYEGEMEKLASENRKNYATFDGDPSVPAEELRKKGAELRDNMAANMASDAARLDFLDKSNATLSTKFKQEYDISSKNQVAIGADRVVQANNKLANSIYGLFKNPDTLYRQKIASLNSAEMRRTENINNSVALLGAEEAQKLRDASAKGMVKAAVLGLMEGTPADAVKFLKERGVKEVLGPEEHEQWMEKAQDRALNFKEIMKQRAFMEVAENNTAEIEKFYNGQHDLASIEAIQDDKTRKLLTDAYLDTKQLSAEEIASREAGLLMQWEDFFQRDGNGRLTANLKKDKKPEDVVKLQQEYMKHFAISRNSTTLTNAAKNYPDMLVQAIKNQQPNPFLKVFVAGLSAFGPVGLMMASSVGPKKKNVDAAAAKEVSQMADVFFNKLEKINLDDSKQVQDAILSTINAHQSRSNPNRARYLIGDVVNTKFGPQEVYGYDDDGKPLLRIKK